MQKVKLLNYKSRDGVLCGGREIRGSSRDNDLHGHAFLQKTAGTAAAGATPRLPDRCSGHGAYKSAGRLREAHPCLCYIQTAFTRSYLLPCTGGYLLIDTGYPGEYDNFLAGLQVLGIGAEQVKYLLLTHHHDDHAGFAARLVKYTGAQVIVHAKALSYLQRGRSEEKSRPVNVRIRCLMGLFSLWHTFTFPPLIATATDIIVSGDEDAILCRIGVYGRMLHTPGHTDDSISVLLADGSAIVGDAAMDFMNYCGTRHRPIYVTDIAQVYASWQKLIARGAKRVYPAHGNPFDVRELMIPGQGVVE